MNVLEYWSPTIVWDNFDQGAISDPVWSKFRQIVQLCHAYRHWDDDLRSKQLSPPKHYVGLVESHRQFKRRQDDWQSELSRSVTNQGRAKYLACTGVTELTYFDTVASGVEKTSDWKLWWVLHIVVPNHPPAAAFESFNADQELTGDTNQIVRRWLQQAGHSV
jgi:hypothetical protein